MRPRAGRTATASQDRPGHDPKSLPKRTESGQNGRPFGVARWIWPYYLLLHGKDKDLCNAPKILHVSLPNRLTYKKTRESTTEVDKVTDLISVSLRLRLGAATAKRVSDRCSAEAPPCRCLFNSPLWLQPCPGMP